MANKIDYLAHSAGHQHKARARAEAEAFEASLLAQVSGPVEQALARTAATMFFSVRLYHWRRISRARRRDKETQEAVAAGNALERLLERLQLLPTRDKPPTSSTSANVSGDNRPARLPAWVRPVNCVCAAGHGIMCQPCQDSWKAREGKQA